MVDLTGYHYLKGNLKTELPTRLCFVDTETTAGPESEGLRTHSLKLGWACRVELPHGKRAYHEEWLSFSAPNQFWEWLTQRADSKSKLYVFAHNWNFDLFALQGLPELTRLGFKCTFWVADGKNFIFKFRRESDQKTLVLLDTFNYSKSSLAVLGEGVGVPKLSIDFGHSSKSELSRYCKQDVLILKVFVLGLIDFIRVNDLGGFTYSTASLAFRSFRHRFMSHKILIHRLQGAIDLERSSYRGGRVEPFFLGEVRGRRLFKLDVDSMYPFVMRSNPYPTKIKWLESSLTVRRLKAYLREYAVIADADIQISKPAIALKRRKLIFPIGRFRVSLTSPELEWVLKNGRILKVHRAAVYERAPIFEAYVDFFHGLKLKAKAEGNVFWYNQTKAYLNHLYGKFGQRIERWVVQGPARSDFVENEIIYDLETGRREHLLCFGGQRWVKTGKVEGENSFAAIASFVTAYARLYLWELIERAGFRNVYYCDTDSLIVNEEGFRRLSKLRGDPALGGLKLEQESEGAFFKGPKDYLFGGVVKLKGVKQVTPREYFDTSTFEVEQFLKFRSLLKFPGTRGPITRHVKKHLRRKYDKARVTRSGWTLPFELSL